MVIVLVCACVPVLFNFIVASKLTYFCRKTRTEKYIASLYSAKDIALINHWEKVLIG